MLPPPSVANDHPMFAEGLASLLLSHDEYRVIGTHDGVETVRKVHELNPDIAIVDVNMPELDGIEAASQIRREHPTTRVIMLTMNDEASLISQAIEAGAHACMLKTLLNLTSSPLWTKPSVWTNNIFLRGSANSPAKRNRPQKMILFLTPGEEILTPREICRCLLVRPHQCRNCRYAFHQYSHGVEGHRMNILRKLNLKSVVGLAKYAVQQGW